ncbi:MAG TPA: phosphoribosylaminoimidazolesuccinocarboxamide synthase [Actinobacteria bacterium]|nr:phosphoribosylaminoimidazolesuccinocarboxamide synthase [Actinomycetota bacterium]
MEKIDKLYEGKAKIIYSTSDPDLVVHEFKNDATAFNAEKKGQIEDKGKVNAQVSASLFKMLAESGVENHFVELLDESTLLTKKVEIILIEVVVRNVAAGSIAKRLGYDEGTKLKQPVVEYYYKDDDLGDPLINEDHIKELGLCDEATLEKLRQMALKTNEALIPYMSEKGLKLIDFKLEFGKASNGDVLLADEISPDTCRLWDTETNEKMDKDRFRRDLGGVEESYKEVLKRITT